MLPARCTAIYFHKFHQNFQALLTLEERSLILKTERLKKRQDIKSGGEETERSNLRKGKKMKEDEVFMRFKRFHIIS